MSPMSSDPETAPEIIGCFRVVRPLGRGSASTVYLGERADQFTQRVAIKLLHETQSRTVLDNEHRLLSSLDHANIVRLLDQGVTVNGQPYLVMEFVDGVPIDQYCDAKRLTGVQRIHLLVQVLGALSYAQRHLVVHADIKPSNILVDATGEPKLLDFGISQQSGSADETVKFVDGDIAQFTPAFASPEQIAGKAVTAVSDIYSAGLVARQLLKAGAAGVASDDLMLILDKATRSEPELRYRNPQDFAEDLRALLEYRPIQARKGNRRYRAGKWVRRNRTAAALALTLLAVLAASVAGVVVQTVRAVHQRRQAIERLHDIVRLTGTLEGELYDSVQPLAQGKQASVMLLQVATQSLDNVAAETQGDSALALEVAGQYAKLGQLERTRNGDAGQAASDVAKALAALRPIRPSDRNYSAAQAQIAHLARQ